MVAWPLQPRLQGAPRCLPQPTQQTHAEGVGCRSVLVQSFCDSVCSVACALTGRGFSTPFVFRGGLRAMPGEKDAAVREAGWHCTWQRPRSERALQAASGGVRLCCETSCARGCRMTCVCGCGRMYVHARRQRSAAQCGCGDQHQWGRAGGQGRVCRCSGAGEVAPSRGVWGLVAHHVPTCWSGPLPPTRQALYRRYIPLGWGKNAGESHSVLARHAARGSITAGALGLLVSQR